MEYLFLAGRVLFGGFFLLSGIRHFQHMQMMSGYAGTKGVPSPRLAVAVSGLLILIGGLLVVLGARPVWAVLLLTAFLVPVTLMMHNYWADTDQMTRINNQVNFMKNMALLGASWMLLLIPEPWPLSVSF